LSPQELVQVQGLSAPETADGIFDLVVPLCLGGCIALSQQDGAEPGLLSATPSQLAAQLRQGDLPGRPWVVRSFGEPLRPSLVERLRAAGVQRVIDSYGSTMGGAWDGPAGASSGVAPTAYVLDRGGELAPVGVLGELWLSSPGPARGYAGNAEATAERFVPDPFGSCAGERLVRTGDLARWRRDGSLELWGGSEREVEVRGLRLDLDHVERMLADHPQVLQAAAKLQEEDGPARLAAYVTAASGEPPTAETLREHLRARLPEAQVPWAVVVLEDLPCTPTGRLDPLSLPRLDTEEYVAPRTEVETTLAGILCELLQVERVGIRENFFRLGGNSLLATQAVARINEAFQLNLGVEILFRHPTIMDLALAMDELLLVQLGDENLEDLLGSF